MRIVSDFRDYYDAVARSGVDPTVVYRRECRDLRGDASHSYVPGRSSSPSRSGACYDPGSLRSCAGRVAFCGEVFPFVARYRPAVSVLRGEWSTTVRWARDVCYDRDGMRSSWRELTPWWSRRRDEFDEWFARRGDLESAFHEHASPVLASIDYPLSERLTVVGDGSWPFSAEATGLIVSPCLADFSFFRVVDPYSAFQRIAGFISGVIGGAARETVEICDRDRVVKAGFDPRTSFRRPPSKGAAA